MNKPVRPALLALLVLGLFSGPSPAAAEETAPKPKGEAQSIDELKKSAPKVFLDGDHLDTNYIKTEIPFVNYVRDRKEADVHVLITQLGTGSGGSEYTLSFIGLGPYEDLKNELRYYSNKIDTRDEGRSGLVQILKLGLAPYVARTPIAALLNLSLNGKVRPTSVVDKWNFWVFSLSANTRLNGEKSRASNSLSGNFSINRTTPEAKFRVGLSGNFDQTRYDYEDYQGTSTSEARAIDALYVLSLSEHWSVGGFFSSNFSTYSNIKLGFTIAPAIEYNVFPYSESTRRQLRILYRFGYNVDNYLEMTVYGRTRDKTWNQTLSATIEFNQPWGNAEFTLEGSNYFLDDKEDAPAGFKIFPPWKFNRFRISGNLSIRIVKGLSLTLDGRYSAIRDQLGLRAGESDLTELLLRRTELASSYSYQARIGLSYSFGSVYSNVVNPRFGGGFGGQSGGYYY